MKIYVRNLTKCKDMEIHLPIREDFEKIIVPGDEYMILQDDNTLDMNELDSIKELNDFLIECQDTYHVTEATLSILSVAFSFKDVKEMITEESYCIIDFTASTKGWNFGTGGDIHSDDKGRLLHEEAEIKFDWEKEHPIVEEMKDFIKWDCLWTTAECNGWQVITCNNNDYLVHR